MKPPAFEMERWQSLHEHDVAYNLAESGVEPLPLRDLLEPRDLEMLLSAPLAYAETQGATALRESVAALYPGCEAENVLITTGTSEANLLTALGTMDLDSRAVTVLPNYLQTWGLAHALSGHVDELRLREADGWQLSAEEATDRIGPSTGAITLSHPNNPTGAPLNGEGRRTLVDLAEEADAWILSDEVYRGAERDVDLTPSFWGTHEKVLVTSGLSKAFGLPGLRLGWICGPRAMIEHLWGLHDYTTIAVSMVTEVLGTQAVSAWRPRLWSRAQEIIQRNFTVLEAFVRENDLSWIPPHAGAIGFVGYPGSHPSVEVAERAREQEVLVVPGAHFGEEGHLRIGFGMEPETLQGGLERLEGVVGEAGSG